MYEVETRQIPERRLLCAERHVGGQEGAWAFGKEFVGILRDRPTPQLEGVEGAAFCIYYGDVSDDGDGPIEWCKPVPPDEAEEIAARYPELTLRAEAAHEEAFVHLGPGDQTMAVQWELVTQTLRGWAEEHGRHPSDLGVRITYIANPPVTEDSVPDCDFAVPLR